MMTYIHLHQSESSEKTENSVSGGVKKLYCV